MDSQNANRLNAASGEPENGFRRAIKDIHGTLYIGDTQDTRRAEGGDRRFRQVLPLYYTEVLTSSRY